MNLGLQEKPASLEPLVSEETRGSQAALDYLDLVDLKALRVLLVLLVPRGNRGCQAELVIEDSKEIRGILGQRETKDIQESRVCLEILELQAGRATQV